MNAEKLISTLRQVMALVDEVIGDLEGTGHKIERSKVSQNKQKVNETKLSFDMNVLAFMNKYSRRLAGPQKFTLLLAHLVKGSASQQVSSAEIEKQWNKMTGTLGGKYNGAYANRAKASGWVDTPKHGIYVLTASWKEAIQHGNV